MLNLPVGRLRFWLAILAFEFILVFSALIPTAMRWREGQTAIYQALEELDRLQSVAAYRSQLEGSAPPEPFASAFLPSKPVSILSADEIASIKTMALAAGVEMQTTNPTAPREDAAITWVGVTVQATGNWPAVLTMLQQIEKSEPLLVFDRLALRTMQPIELQQQADTILSLEADIAGAARISTAAVPEVVAP